MCYHAKPRIAVTMGDPAGVGPELSLRLLTAPALLERCVPVVFGSAAVLVDVAEACSLPAPDHVVTVDEWARGDGDVRPACVVDWATPEGPIRPGRVDAECGRASFCYVEKAIDAALDGRVAAVVTCPINKEALRLGGIHYPGHTEIFSERAGMGRTCMMMTSDVITVSLVTTHVGYREAAGLLTERRILDVIELTAATMRKRRGRPARLAVCGLNPHAGEHGLFGADEEARLILPAIEAAQGAGLTVEGPLPPDTAFVPARLAQTDAVVCMYHDQGLIPFKMMAFDQGVNVTLGLSIVRTSVDHGTAFDIAWKGVASPESLFRACVLAAELAG